MNQLLDSTDMGIAARPRRVKRAHPADDLSFMASKKPRGSGIDYWIVEGTGGYGTDFAKGAELAEEYLSYLAKNPTNGNATLLGCIVNSMIARPEVQEKGRLTGIEIAFLDVVNRHALAAALILERYQK